MDTLDNNGFNSNELKSEEKYGKFDQFADADDAFMIGDEDDSSSSGLDSYSLDSDNYSFNDVSINEQKIESVAEDTLAGEVDATDIPQNENSESSNLATDEPANNATDDLFIDAESKARQELLELINQSKKAQKDTPVDDEEIVEKKSFSDIDANESEEIEIDDLFPEHPSVIDLVETKEQKETESMPKEEHNRDNDNETKDKKEKKFPLLLFLSIIAGVILIAGGLWFADSKLHFISSVPKDSTEEAKLKNRHDFKDERVSKKSNVSATIKAHDSTRIAQDSILAKQRRIQDSIFAEQSRKQLEQAKKEAELAAMKAKQDSIKAKKANDAKISRDLSKKYKKEEAERKARGEKIEVERQAKAQKDKELRAEKNRIRAENNKQAAIAKEEAKAKRDAEKAKLAEVRKQKQEADKAKKEATKQAKQEAQRAKQTQTVAKKEEAKNNANAKDAEFTVQVYASPSREDAINWLNKINKKVGGQATMTTQIQRDVKWYRIRFGKFKSREDAENAARRAGFNQVWIDRVK